MSLFVGRIEFRIRRRLLRDRGAQYLRIEVRDFRAAGCIAYREIRCVIGQVADCLGDFDAAVQISWRPSTRIVGWVDNPSSTLKRDKRLVGIEGSAMSRAVLC
jgi:hypothetical protein